MITSHARRSTSAAWMLILLLVTPCVIAQDVHQRFELAFTPFLPVRTMMLKYEPMRVFLEDRLKEPVALVTAMDYQTFNRRMRNYEYAFVVTVANSAYLAHSEYGYSPMLRPALLTRPVLVTSKKNRIKSLKGLRGASIALPDRLSVVSMQGLQMLREAGLQPETHVRIKYTPNHTAAINFVISGEANAAIVSDRAVFQLPADTQKDLRIVQTWDAGAMPGVVYMASPKTPAARVERMRQAILAYVRDTDSGRDLIKSLGYGELVTATAADLTPFAAYGEQLKAAQEMATP